MMARIRYTREELLEWQEAGEAEARDSLLAMMPQELLCPAPARQPRRRNVDRRQRPRHSPECQDAAMGDLSESLGAFEGEEAVEEEEEEGVFGESDYSDDEGSLQPLAFLVRGEPDFESGPPQDGFEYLRRVIWETAQCPKVKVAKIGKKKLYSKQTNYMPEIPPIPTCSPDLLPSKEWVQSFLKDFSYLRAGLLESSASHEDAVEDLPSIRNSSAWKSFCFGRSRSHDLSDEQEDSNNTGGSSTETFKESAGDGRAESPYLKLLLRLDEISRATLFRYHVSWLNEQSKVAYDRAMWLFALAAAVDSPLDDQTSAAFRDMLRKCAELRVQKTEVDEELYMINILVTIAGEYFGQAENLSVISA